MTNVNYFPPGSYQMTARNIMFSKAAKGRYVLHASLQRYKDENAWVDSSLAYDIANNDGKLEWAPRGVDRPVTPPEEAEHVPPPSEQVPPGTYLLTSRNVTVVELGRMRLRIEAECQTLGGEWVRSKLDYDIVNCDGEFKWDPHGKLVEAMYKREGPK